MTKLLKRHHTAAIFCVLAVFALASCTADTSFRSQAESYIGANISELSTRSATLGGTFRVTDIEWVDEDSVLVSYEDGHIALTGRADVSIAQNGDVFVTNFRIVNNIDDSDSSSSDDDLMQESSSSEDDKEDEDEDEDENESSSSTGTMMEES